MDTDITYWLGEMVVTFVVSLIFNILPSLISKEKIDFVKVLKTTLISSSVSLVYKFVMISYNPIFDPDEERYAVSVQSLILSPLLLSIITNVGQLLLNKEKLTLKNIIVDTSNTVKHLSTMNLLSDLSEFK